MPDRKIDGDASTRWWALSLEEQDAENAARRERGEKPIPTHRHRPRLSAAPPILLSLGGSPAIAPIGECLACGHLMALAAWKEAPLGEVTHGICGPCRDAALSQRGDCSTERACLCESMGDKAVRREQEIRDRDKRARIALAREESSGR